MSTSVALAEELAHAIESFQLQSDPACDRLAERARHHLLDVIGLAMAGWLAEDAVAESVVRTVAGLGESTILGTGRTSSCAGAAFANGVLAQVWTFDDIDMSTTMHAQGFAVPSALAVAEGQRSTGMELLEAIVVGIEVALRLASGVRGRTGMYTSGFHSTSVFGTLGSAAGAAKLMRLDRETTATALALAVSFASGSTAAWHEGTGRNKIVQPGWAAQAGITAATLAANGYPCGHSTIDGERGLFAAHAWDQGWDRDPILDGIGTEWRLFNLEIKGSPVGSSAQGVLDCAMELAERHGVRGEDVVGGLITMPHHYGTLLRDAGEALYRPESGAASIGAYPLVAARALLSGGSFTIEHRTDRAIREPALLDLADRLKMEAVTEPWPTDSALPPPTTMEVVLRDGQTRRVSSADRTQMAEGARLLRKFTENVDAAGIDGSEIASNVDRIAAATDVSSLLDACARATSDRSR